MKKFLKIAGISIFVLLILMLTVPYLFRGKIQQTIINEANKSVNAKINFDLSLSMFKSFPNLSVELNKLQVIGIDTFATDTLAAFESLRLDVNLFSVLGEQIEIKAITLNEPRFNVIVLKDGKANYDIAKPSTDTVKAPADTSVTKFKLQLQKFVINNGFIVYDDATFPVYVKMEGMNYKMKGDFTEATTSIDNNMAVSKFTMVYDGVKYLSQVAIAFDAKIDADLNKFAFTFKDNLLSVNDLQMTFEGLIEMPKDDIGMDIKFGLKKAEFKSLLSLIPAIYSKDFEKVKTSGKMAFDGYAKGIYNDKTLPAFGVKLLVENAMFQYPDLPKSVENINIDVKVDNQGGTGDNNEIDIKKFHVEMAKNPFDVQMHISTSAADVALKGNMTGIIDFTSIADLIPLENTTIKGLMSANVNLEGKLSSIETEQYQDFNANGTLDLTDFYFKSPDVPQPVSISKTVFYFTPQYLDLATFDMMMGNSDIHLQGKLQNYLAYALKDSTLQGTLNYSSNLLNVNELMPTSSAPDTTLADTAAVTAFEIPKNIDFTLTSQIGKILYDSLEISNVKGIIVLRNAKADLQNLQMNLLQGSMKLNGSYDAADFKNPKVDFGINLLDFDITETAKTFVTIQKLSPIAKHCFGKISADLKLTTALDYTLSPVYNSINGSGRFVSKSLEITGSKIFEKLSDALKSDKYRKFTAKDVNAGFSITDGTIVIEPFTTNLGNGKTTISGKQGLDQTINYVFNIEIPRSEFGTTGTQVLDNLYSTAGAQADANKTIKFDVFVEGTVTDPKIKLGLKDAFKDAVNDVKDKAKEELDKKKEELKKQASAEAQKILAEADKKANDLIAKAQQEAQTIRDVAKRSGDEIIKQADAEGQKLIKQAGNNPIAKAAAQKTAEKLNKEAKDKAQKLNSEADQKATALVDKAKKEADVIRQNAQIQADKLNK